MQFVVCPGQIMTLDFAKDELNFLHFITEIEFIFFLTIRFTFFNEILLGKPTIKGTRLSVEQILSLFAQGWRENQILENYPRLRQDGSTH